MRKDITLSFNLLKNYLNRKKHLFTYINLKIYMDEKFEF
jgi:hypothetical protein